MPASITDFPDICNVIYRERTSIAGIYSRYIEELEKTSSRYNQGYANKLKAALDMQKPAKLREVERDFADFKTYMKKFTAKHNIYLVITKRQKDFIFHPTKNGYQSLHTVLEMQNGLTFEIQVRTFAMDVVSKYGSASHLVFEEKRREPTDICLDLSKVEIPGFTALPDGTIIDNIGLVKSINPFEFL